MKRSYLQRRTPLKRGSGPTRKTGLKPISDKQKAMLKVDAVARQVVRDRDFSCQAAGIILEGKPSTCSTNLQWAHLRTRGIKAIRHDPRNGMLLCENCHTYFTAHPKAWKEFYESRDPGVTEYLAEKMRNP